MKIACLGWGSLIWDKEDRTDGLPLRSSWHNNGPKISVEFVRQSADGRITLVIFPGAKEKVTSLWAEMDCGDPDQCRSSLAKREKCKEKYIGLWRRSEKVPENITDLSHWAINHEIDAVVWTKLPPKFNKVNRAPTVNEFVEYIKFLKLNDLDKYKKAVEYIRKAPQQINTEYRRRIETEIQETRIV